MVSGDMKEKIKVIYIPDRIYRALHTSFYLTLTRLPFGRYF